MAVQAERFAPGVRHDEGVEFRVTELGDRPAAAANEVVVVFASGDFIAHAAIAKREPADEVQVLSLIHISEPTRPY